MPLDRIVLIIVVAGGALLASVWLLGLLVAATQTPLAWLLLIPVALAGYIVWRVVADRVTSEEDDHYDKVPRE